MQIDRISPLSVNGVQNLSQAQKPASAGLEQVGESFGQILSGLSQSEMNADNLVQQLSLGENVDLHQVMIGIEENDVNFRVAMAIRDRLVDAYREVMRMQI